MALIKYLHERVLLFWYGIIRSDVIGENIGRVLHSTSDGMCLFLVIEIYCHRIIIQSHEMEYFYKYNMY